MASSDILIVDDNVELASLLGTLIAEQGLTPILAHTASDAIALNEHYRPGAIVVDLLLPDMTGHKLIAAVARAGASSPSIFVMTGVFKGEAQIKKVRAIAPIAAWHEKPFETRLLIEEILDAIAKGPSKVREAHKRVEEVLPDFDIDILDPVEHEGIRARAREPERIPSRAFIPVPPSADLDLGLGSADAPEGLEMEVEVDEQALLLWDVVENATPTAEVAGPDTDEIVLPALESPGSDDFTEEPPTVPYRDPFADRVIEGAAQPVAVVPTPSGRHEPARRPTPPSPPKAIDEKSPLAEQMRTGLRAKIRSGQLRSPTVARLLTAFYVARETGEIAFEHGNERKVIYFSEGRPVFARSNQDADRLGAIAQRATNLSKAQIDTALAVARATDRMIGSVLIDQGLIGEERRGELVRAQTRTIIRSLLTWADGRYVIGFNVAGEIERAELNEHPATLVLQGVRELFDLDRLKRLVSDRMFPMPAPNPPYELSELSIGDPQALLLLRSTGKRSVRDLVGELKDELDEKGVRATLHAFLALGILVAGQSAERFPQSRTSDLSA